MVTLSIQAAKASDAELPEMPIEPSWILEGSPEARGTVLVQSADKLVSSGLWSCTAGSFRWEFGWDEFVHVLEGEVTITEEDGKSYTLQPGDTAHFPLGLKTRWLVPKFVKKVFTLRTPQPLEI